MAYQRYKLAKTGAMTGDVYLFTEFKENWQYFFNETTMTPDAPGEVDKVVNVKSHTVRRGPGDPRPFTRVASSRKFARIAKSKGSARPGNPYIVGEKAALGPGYREKRQFALLGDDLDIQMYVKQKAKFEVVLWDYRGGSKVYPAAAGGTLSAQGAPANP